jgi:hypothetical protein
LQNRKDAIKETSKLYKRDFTVLDRGFNLKDVYIVEARHPDTTALLGFIRWEKGKLEFANFGAHLSRKTLNLGATTKFANNDMAGTHGEGFKVGSLVMVRTGYTVRYEASGFFWNFKLRGQYLDLFYCMLNPMKPEALKKKMEKYQLEGKKGLPRPLRANIWEDVAVTIGKLYGGKAIEKDDFLKWIKVALDLDPPSKMLRTGYGNLILDKEFSGRIYLKGLLMEGCSSVKSFKFGYNFFQGEVNRDRQRLTNAREEAKMLGSIWGEAIQLDEAATLPQLVDMLQSDNSYADVDLAEDNMSEHTAKKVWRYLLGQDVERKRFYYYVEHGDKVYNLPLLIHFEIHADCRLGRGTDHEEFEKGAICFKEADMGISTALQTCTHARGTEISSLGKRTS